MSTGDPEVTAAMGYQRPMPRSRKLT